MDFGRLYEEIDQDCPTVQGQSVQKEMKQNCGQYRPSDGNSKMNQDFLSRIYELAFPTKT